MGLERNTARFLLQARKNGAPFAKVLTIGRQNFFVDSVELKTLATEFGFPPTALQEFAPADRTYVEPFFRSILETQTIESIDVSGYENATHIHDLNYPLPEKLRNQYDVVFDAGSLEHILNFPQAIRSLMEATRVGGRVFIQTPANNYFGHGFYQFSAELFYRIFSPENGFQTERVVVFEHFFPCHFFAAPWYEVRDPQEVRSRVQLVNKRPLLLMVQAVKTAEKNIFEKIPQQSDYVPVWQNEGPKTHTSPLAFLKSAKNLLYRLPLSLVGTLWAQYFANRGNKPALKNHRHFKQIN